MRLISRISNVFLLITAVCLIISVKTIIEWDLFFHMRKSPDPSFRFQLYILIAIPLLFAGITITLKLLNKALTDQSISFMKMMADSKKSEKKS